ncbi:hypothetical protein GLW04_13020 [Halobacillus litoralis]|uniref:VanZ-like domain-containing protein n=2 Tax=Halobacillus litoralis TaxID=45668 RepID=A0A845E3I6_9BACI|nr:hypothetical protein [Halobacillus litoralis]
MAAVQLPDCSSERVDPDMAVTLGACLEAMHLIEFALLYGLIITALCVHGKLTQGTSVAAGIFSMMYGVVDECHQWFTPGRSFSWIDIAKDWTGVLILMAVVHGKLRKSSFHKKGPRREARSS